MLRGGAFAAFYAFYAAAPVVFADSSPPAGARIAMLMLVVVAVQPLVLIAGRRLRDRRPTVLAALAAMGLGTAAVPVAGHWPGPLLLAAGFGVFVVTSTAWVKEAVDRDRDHLGRALGLYGFASAVGGTIGAPTGLLLAHHAGIGGAAITGALFAAIALVPTFRARSAPNTGSPGGLHSRSPEATAIAARRTTRTRHVTVITTSAAGHLLAVTVYATALSALGPVSNGEDMLITVGSAFVIQASLSLGRLIAGTLSDRWSPLGTGAIAVVLLTAGAVSFAVSASPVALVVAAGLIGVTSGTGQTAALTAMMRRAHGPAGTERASATWNIVFDLGLGLGALTAGHIVVASE